MPKEDKLMTQVVAGLPAVLAALVKERISPEELRELTKQAAMAAARQHSAEDSLAEATISEVRQLILARLPDSAQLID